MLALLLICFGCKGGDLTYYVIDDVAEPFQIVGKDGRHSGILTELVELIAADEHIELSFRHFPFKRMIKYMEMKVHHNWLNYGAPEWGNVQSLRLSSEPLLTVNHILLTQRGVSYTEAKDLFGKTLVLIGGFNYPGLERYIANGKIKALEVSNHKRAIELVKRGRVVGFPEMEVRLKYHFRLIGENPAYFEFQDLSNLIPAYKIYLSFSPHFPLHLYHKFNIGLARLKSNHTVQQIITQYTGLKRSQKKTGESLGQFVPVSFY